MSCTIADPDQNTTGMGPKPSQIQLTPNGGPDVQVCGACGWSVDAFNPTACAMYYYPSSTWTCWRGHVYDSSHDVSWRNSWSQSAEPYFWAGSSWRGVLGSIGYSSHYVGMFVCHYGINTQYSCGTVSSTTFQPPTVVRALMALAVRTGSALLGLPVPEAIVAGHGSSTIRQLASTRDISRRPVFTCRSIGFPISEYICSQHDFEHESRALGCWLLRRWLGGVRRAGGADRERPRRHPQGRMERR